MTHLRIRLSSEPAEANGGQVRIPARHLNLPEADKSGPAFEAVFTNPGLASAVLEDLRDFRPIFDGGALLFPSRRAPGQSLSENRLGQIVGDLAAARFGIRISIHRLRDNWPPNAPRACRAGPRRSPPFAARRRRFRETLTTGRDHPHGMMTARS